MDRNGWKCLEMAGNVWKRQGQFKIVDIAQNSWKWVGIDGNGCNYPIWMEMSGNVWKWLEMTGHVSNLVKMA